MALRPCPHCGRLISPRATTCLHCGQDTTTPPLDADANAAETSPHSSPALRPCPQCGHFVSVRAQQCVNCGVNLTTAASAPQSATPPPQITPDYLVYKKSRSHKGGIIALVVIVWLFIIACVGYFVYHHYMPPAFDYNDTIVEEDSSNYQTDTAALESSNTATDAASASPAADESEAADSSAKEPSYRSSASAEDVFDKPHRPEDGFRSNDDVRRFVEDNTYWRNGLSLRISDGCIYAGDNDIATNSPSFKRVSNNVGLITARPNISITVRRTSNTLVDNRSGEVYRLNGESYAPSKEKKRPTNDVF